MLSGVKIHHFAKVSIYYCIKYLILNLAYCGSLPELTYGSYECNGNDLGSTCEVKCSNGTRVDGERSLICKQDNAGMAYWFGDMVQCIRTCPQRMIRTPPLKVDCTSGLDVGSYCTFGCTNEAMLHGSKNVKCQIDSNGMAKWSHDFPICRPQCPQIPDREGQRVKCTSGRLGGSECKFSCDPNGWKLAGNTTVQCKIHRERQTLIKEEINGHMFDLDGNEMIERAHWSVPNLPSCRRKTCPKLPKLTNGQLACTGYDFEDSCRFECNEGFLLKGENATECLGGVQIIFYKSMILNRNNPCKALVVGLIDSHYAKRNQDR